MCEDHRRHLIGRAAVLKQCGQWQCLEVLAVSGPRESTDLGSVARGRVQGGGNVATAVTAVVPRPPCGNVGSDWPLRIGANRQCLRQCGGSTWR